MSGARFWSVVTGSRSGCFEGVWFYYRRGTGRFIRIVLSADAKLVELGLTPDGDAFKAEYYTYMMNGLMTQLVRIEPGNSVEEAHMRNRQLIARWVYEKGAADKAVELVKKDGKTYVVINDYPKVRQLFGELLAEIQRIKSRPVILRLPVHWSRIMR